MISRIIAPLILAALATPSIAETSPLRILPVGASVTFGVGSSTGSSYRKDLRALLTADPDPHLVNFVGRNSNGDFVDNQVEATSGFVMAQIADAARIATPMFKPNVILVEAGTNNCNSGNPVPDAGRNMTALIDELFALSEGVTVIMATLLENKIPEQDACRVDVNRQYQVVRKGFEGQGRKFVLVDMRSEEGPTTADLFDTRHPNDVGYAKMARVWEQGVREAVQRGFVVPPVENGIPFDGDAGNSTAGVQRAAMGVSVTSLASRAEGSLTRFLTQTLVVVGCTGMVALGLGVWDNPLLRVTGM
ncbi:hypothetical protein OQA88_10634 [Cercophora sp. LCS_1]